jgi:hypothetical protein
VEVEDLLRGALAELQRGEEDGTDESASHGGERGGRSQGNLQFLVICM